MPVDWTPENIFLAIEYGLEATAADVITQAQRDCPVRTGTLQGSLRFEPPKDLRIELGSFDVNYAAYVDQRTRFLSKAMEEIGPTLPERIQEALR